MTQKVEPKGPEEASRITVVAPVGFRVQSAARRMSMKGLGTSILEGFVASHAVREAFWEWQKTRRLGGESVREVPQKTWATWPVAARNKAMASGDRLMNEDGATWQTVPWS